MMNTYSIVGRCSRTGMVGMAITTSSIAVAARCLWVEAGTGAVATQNVTDPRLGRLGLELLGKGLDAETVIDALVEGGDYPEHRQLACVDMNGLSAAFSGNKVLGVHAHRTGPDVAVAGNLLSSTAVVDAMFDAFVAEPDAHLADRLLLALVAGKEAGGEVGGNERSAGLKVCHQHTFPLVDLRIDWDEKEPIAALSKLWERYQPEMDAYVTRAIDPTSAPPFEAEGSPAN